MEVYDFYLFIILGVHMQTKLFKVTEDPNNGVNEM